MPTAAVVLIDASVFDLPSARRKLQDLMAHQTKTVYIRNGQFRFRRMDIRKTLRVTALRVGLILAGIGVNFGHQGVCYGMD